MPGTEVGFLPGEGACAAIFKARSLRMPIAAAFWVLRFSVGFAMLAAPSPSPASVPEMGGGMHKIWRADRIRQKIGRIRKAAVRSRSLLWELCGRRRRTR